MERRIICKWLVNNQQFSDVQFLVGVNKDLVYAHKIMLASGKLNLIIKFIDQLGLTLSDLGSPVFEKYFYADHNLKMLTSEPIEVPDLSTVGFINMIK